MPLPAWWVPMYTGHSGKGKSSGIDLTSREVAPVLETLARLAREKGLRFVWIPRRASAS